MSEVTETVCETWELALTEPDAKCEGWRDQCPNPATWLLRISCGCRYLSCDECKRLEDANRDEYKGHCCGASYVTWTWTRI